MQNKRNIDKDDIVGKHLNRIFLRRDSSVEGFNYVEAIVELDDGLMFAVNESGVDSPAPLPRLELSQNTLEVAKVGFDKILGKTITHVAVADSVGTLVVVCGGVVLLGMDCGPPFDSFAPSATNIGEIVDRDELLDDWGRDQILVSS